MEHRRTRWRRLRELELCCSFCGKPQAKVKRLIAGPTVYICEECVGLSADIIAEDKARQAAGKDDAISLDGLSPDVTPAPPPQRTGMGAAAERRHPEIDRMTLLAFLKAFFAGLPVDSITVGELLEQYRALPEPHEIAEASFREGTSSRGEASQGTLDPKGAPSQSKRR